MEIYLFKKEDVKDSDELIKHLAREKYQLNFLPEIAREEWGKPFFQGLDEIHFSVSHSGDLWALALDDKPIGLDIEKATAGKRDWLKIAERFFTEEEYSYVQKHGSLGFHRIWVRKEACLKFTGQGLSGGLKNFTLVKNVRLVKKLPMGYVLEFSPGPGYFGACCSGKNLRREDLLIKTSW